MDANSSIPDIANLSAGQSEKKPVSDAKIEANRANAQKSTGPKTPEGKAASSRNAMKHGLTAAAMVLPNENITEFEEFRAEMLDALQPSDRLEAHFAERVIAAAWRLNRVTKAESEIIRSGLEGQWRYKHTLALSMKKPIGTIPGVEESTAEVLLELMKKRDTLSKLSRYEAAIERSLHRALHELQRFQAQRAGKDVPPPVAVDIDVAVQHPAAAAPTPAQKQAPVNGEPVEGYSENGDLDL
ncbi:MAG: hypothetical protein IT450_18700 [Phycisphaerales bacterium]|nr:hypothetical protein [Phycisphaerales bacterium]